MHIVVQIDGLVEHESLIGTVVMKGKHGQVVALLCTVDEQGGLFIQGIHQNARCSLALLQTMLGGINNALQTE